MSTIKSPSGEPQGHTISGNGRVGVYVFGGTASGNRIQSNIIGAAIGGRTGPGNGEYGVLLFNAPRNQIDRTGSTRNRFAGNKIANIREFTGGSSRR